MNNMKLLPALLVVGLVLVALSGCTGNSNYQSSTNPPVVSGNNNTTVTTAPTADSMATELTSGTGNGSNDVTTEELDAMDNDMDDLDVAADQSEQSNI